MCLRSNVLRCVFSVSYETNDKKYQVIVIYAHTFIALSMCSCVCVCGWTLTNNSHINVMCVVYTIYRKVEIRLDARVHCMYSDNHEICDEFRTLYLVYQCIVVICVLLSSPKHSTLICLLDRETSLFKRDKYILEN